MKIAVLATNRNPLIEPYAGGQESLTAALSRGFRRRGHTVVLFAAGGTDPVLADEIVPYLTLPRISEVAALDPQVPEKPFLDDHHAFTAAVRDLATRTDIDVIANHSLHHLPLSLSTLLPAPVVTTLHTPPFPWMELGAALAAPSARYVAVSDALRRQWATLAADVVRNGADAGTFVPGPGGTGLVWVGRITPEKAPHVAIEVARRSRRRLTLVGPISDESYWRARVKPLLSDDVTWAGAVSRSRLVTLVGESAALLMTPVWDEPFGLVAAEAALCGTPTLALDRGGVAEAVTPRTGILVPDGGDEPTRISALVEALPQLGKFDRADVRRAAEDELSLDRCVEEHLRILTRASTVRTA